MIRYYSDLTKNYYETPEEATQAEEALIAEKKNKENEKQLHLDTLRGLWDDMEAGRKKANEATKHYNEDRDIFIKSVVDFHKKYGYIPDEYRSYSPLTMFFSW